jgi:hypothetical protein
MNLGFWNFYPFYNANRMFKDASSALGDDLSYPSVYLARHLRALGHQVNTLDMAALESFDAAIFLDHPTFLNSYYRRLRRMPGKKLYLFLLENPAHRPDNYWRWNHRAFDKVFTWNLEWVDHKKYFQLWLPVKIPESFRINPAEKTKFCVTVVSQKYSGHRQELYSERVRGIRWFEREHPAAFDLYGLDWDRIYFTGKLSRLNLLLQRIYVKCPGLMRRRRFPSHRGPVPRKDAVMRQYKFAMAYENAAFPGYVTEKIFDALFAGCVPVYLGAPNVTDYIPADTFIDRRNFRNYEELYQFLTSMSEKDYLGYIRAIEDFVRGDRIKVFGAENLTRIVLKEIVEPNAVPPAARR